MNRCADAVEHLSQRLYPDSSHRESSQNAPRDFSNDPASPVARCQGIASGKWFDRNQGNILRARAELSAAHEQLKRVELMLHRPLAAVFQEYDNARATVVCYRSEILPAAEETLQLGSRGYQQGKVGYLELLTVQRTFFQTSLDLVAAFRDLQINRTRIENLLLSNALDEPAP